MVGQLLLTANWLMVVVDYFICRRNRAHLDVVLNLGNHLICGHVPGGKHTYADYYNWQLMWQFKWRTNLDAMA